MSERYTRPELSRQLAEAGVEQYYGALAVYYQRSGDRKDGWRISTAKWRRHQPGVIRALDLTDVTAEIERLGATWLVETDGAIYCATAVLNPQFSAVMSGPSAAEAAGLCLLALLDKAKEVKNG